MHLVGVDVDDLLDAEREEHVEEEDLVAPDDALLLRLLRQPLGPLVRDVAHLEAVLLGNQSRDINACMQEEGGGGGVRGARRAGLKSPGSRALTGCTG